MSLPCTREPEQHAAFSTAQLRRISKATHYRDEHLSNRENTQALIRHAQCHLSMSDCREHGGVKGIRAGWGRGARTPSGRVRTVTVTSGQPAARRPHRRMSAVAVHPGPSRSYTGATQHQVFPGNMTAGLNTATRTSIPLPLPAHLVDGTPAYLHVAGHDTGRAAAVHRHKLVLRSEGLQSRSAGLGSTVGMKGPTVIWVLAYLLLDALVLVPHIRQSKLLRGDQQGTLHVTGCGTEHDRPGTGVGVVTSACHMEAGATTHLGGLADDGAVAQDGVVAETAGLPAVSRCQEQVGCGGCIRTFSRRASDGCDEASATAPLTVMQPSAMKDERVACGWVSGISGRQSPWG